ncbi:MAG TPA: NAD(P)/FAD-dependent oxidoreductase [Thermoanaerobaculia bacterium]|nr:NAD(P)/FAD-dependent oxidoreductase [Thermoanaerobaculia bacterium]HQR66919.1 NAD(P)/FAD-dependent oxidoreductase [Thermoanaerobaculia bacterium]
MGRGGTGWDAIVIGSGIGGLTTAVLLGSLHGKRVLVLERHDRPGGFTHVFSRRGGFRWDVGVHYVGEIGERGLSRDVLEVATGGEVRWKAMPEGYDRLFFPGFEFTIRSGWRRFRDDLVAAFPREVKAIHRYFADVRRAASYVTVLGMRGTAPPAVVKLADAWRARARRLALATTGAWLEANVTDERLKAVLGARWGDYGLPPGQSAFLAHAVIARHYFEGGWYPAGSAASIGEAARRRIEAAGGAVRLRTPVERILVDGAGRAAGVRLATGEEIPAPVVVSDAGARNTYLRLLPEEVSLPFRAELESTPAGMAHLSLYLGLARSPEPLGIRGENLWIHDGLDQDALWARQSALLAGEAPQVYVSFPSLKDPEATAHTAEVIAAVDGAAFSRWAGTRWRRRGPEYDALKEKLAETLLDAVERRVPGFRDLVVYRELSTPLSTEHFTGHPGGEIYGIPATPERFTKGYLQVRTPVPGLFLTGADALFLGVVGAARAGLQCAVAVAGPSTFWKTMREARRLRSAR